MIENGLASKGVQDITIESAQENIEREKLISADYKNKIKDADVAELFTDLSRQQNVLQASYKARRLLERTTAFLCPNRRPTAPKP